MPLVMDQTHWEDWSSPGIPFLNDRYSKEEAGLLTHQLRKLDSRFLGHLILLSSGTSGKSKWIALSKEAFLVSAQAVNDHLSVTSEDTWLLTLPQFHVGGLGILARAYLSRSKVFSLEGKWDASVWVNTLIQNCCTLSSLVPTQIYDLVSLQLRAPSCLRGVFVGGGSLNPDLGKKAEALGWPLLATYGMTETCSQVASAKSGESSEFNLLPILPHWQVKETSEKRLLFRGKSLLTAYLHVRKNQVQVEDPKDSDGWFLSQDRGEVKSGLLKIFGRSGDVIKVSGELVDVAHLNERLRSLKHSLGVAADIALIAIPHARLGMQISLVSDRFFTAEQADQILKEFNEGVLPFERIREWKCIGILPRTELGKLISSSCVTAWG